MAAVLGTTLLTSCLEKIDPQTSTVTEEQVANAPGVFDKFVATLTSSLCGEFLYSGASNARVYDHGYPAFFLTRDVEGQDIVPVGTNNWFDTWYQNFTYLAPGWAVTQLPWTVYYGWIKGCNDVISMGGASGYATPTEGRETGVGMAYALRAMFYLDLCRMYSAKPYYQDHNAATTVKITEASSRRTGCAGTDSPAR